MTVQALVQSMGAGDLYCTHEGFYAAVTEAYNAANETSAASAVAVNANVLKLCKSLTMSSIAAGDYVTLKFTRTGGNAGDTINDSVFFKGWLVTYTADS
jgi:hypothetical protein